MSKVIVKMRNGETEMWEGLTQEQAAHVATGYQFVNGVQSIRVL
jgi:hypothetical protein